MHSVFIDILRVVLCALVVEHHMLYHVMAGNVAVVGFFVLAGWFMAKSFEKSGKNFDFCIFYRKKALNLMPEYMAGAMLGGLPYLMGEEFKHVDFSASACTLSTLAETLNYPCWFMTCLLLFFMLAPVFFCLHKAKWGIPLAFVASGVYATGLYLTIDNTRNLYYSSQCNLVFFFAGMFAYRLWRGRSVSTRVRNMLAVASPVLILLLIMLQTPSHEWLFSYACCALFMVLVPMIDVPSGISSWWSRGAVWAAGLTYAMYLFHVPVWQIFKCLGTCIAQQEGMQQILFRGLSVLLTLLISACFVALKKGLIRRFCSKECRSFP